MKNNSFGKTLNNGSTKAGLAFCALILAAACGKEGGSNTTDPNNKSSIGADSNNVGNSNNSNNANNSNSVSGQVTATDGGKTEALKFALFYQNPTPTDVKKTFTFALTDYDYCAFSAAHNPGGYPANTTFANLSFYLPGDGTSAALKPGTFTVGTDIPNGQGGNIGFTGFTNNCSFKWPAVKSGTVTIKSVTASVVTGTVDLQLQDNDGVSTGSIKGDFTTSACTQMTSSSPVAGDAGVCQTQN